MAKEVGVQHLIFSSLLSVKDTTKGCLANVPHFDIKAEVEQYIHDSGVPATFFLPMIDIKIDTGMLRLSAIPKAYC